MVIITPRNLARSAFLCSIIVIVSQVFRFGSAIIPFSLLPGVYVLGTLVFSPLENGLGWAIYLLLGLIGIPVFATPPYGGFGYIFKPTFGFLLGYPLLSTLVSWIVQRKKEKTRCSLLFLSIMAIVLLYGPGLIYLWIVLRFFIQAPTSFIIILKTGFFPFIGGDILKAFVAFFIAWKARPVWGGSEKN